MASWDTYDGEYDPDGFYPEASDKKGHSVEIRARFPTNIAATVIHLVETRSFGEYRNKADLVRDAVYHRLKTLEKKLDDPEFTRQLTLASLVHSAVKREQELEMAETHTRRVEQLLMRYRQSGQWEQLDQLVEEQITGLHLLPPEVRKQMVAMLERYQPMG